MPEEIIHGPPRLVRGRAIRLRPVRCRMARTSRAMTGKECRAMTGKECRTTTGKGCRGHDGERITSRRQGPLVSGSYHTGQTHLRRSPEACPRSESMPRFRAFPGGVPVVQRQVFILTHGPLPLTAIFHRLEGNVACASTTRSISTTEIRVKVIPTTEPGKIHRSVVTR
jgi:hypothetical protein